jgi:hypothetical protein
MGLKACLQAFLDHQARSAQPALWRIERVG